jgi:CRISPR-associated protein Cmr1
MMGSLNISIRTLTPLWTGDVYGRCLEIKETGIIGNLRWWYESIVRGLGGNACDISNQCKIKNGLCDVCRIFGTTEWKRQFNLSIIKDETKPAWSDNLPLNVRPPERTRGWFLPPGKIGRFDILFQGNSEAIGQICSVFLFLESWGSLGAKPQLGYGFFKIINRDEVKEKAIKFKTSGNTDEKAKKNLPNLSKWILFRCRFKPQKNDWWTWIEGIQRLLGDHRTAKILSQLANMEMVPVSPVLKNQWKYVQWQAPFEAKAWLLGKAGDDRRRDSPIRSKVPVSWAYRDGEDWVIRGWASLAENDKILNYQEYIESFKTILLNETVWRKALNLDSVSLKELTVISEKAEILKLLEIKHD